MGRRVLYVYLDESEPNGAGGRVAAELERAVSVSAWTLAAPAIVNDVGSRGDASRHRDLPPWDVGLTLALPESGCEPCEWFRDVERFARITGEVVSRTGCHFVLGVAEYDAGLWQDLFVIDTPAPDVVVLAAAVSRLTGLGLPPRPGK
jgi:hypothetical protein